MSQSVKMLILLAEMVIALSKPNSVTEKRTVMMAQMRMHVVRSSSFELEHKLLILYDIAY